ncbi:MAG: NAD(P)/FAD-dependent oxidoreductase [Erysipelotrichales bacterium]|nr:NAD(P)/FAD-dependent oxidoreductase [Erysipelotrichales bacterium]
MKKYDVIIIGAGIAGVTFGYLMRNKNKKVLIVEKTKISSKDKLCGGLLSDKSYYLLKDIFNIDNDDITIKNNKKSLMHNNETLLDLDVDTFSIYRKDLDSYILKKYLNQGGELIEESQYENLDLDNNTLEIDNIKYEFDYLIGADGVFSSLRKEITGKVQRRNFALELLYEKQDLNLEIFFFNNFKGYGWIIPNNKNAMIGVGEVSGKTNIEDTLNLLFKKFGVFSTKNIRGAFLPTGDDIYLNYKNVFFIGDSAGLISPITGEGIYYALASAKILSENLNNKYFKKMKRIIRKIKNELFYKKYVYNDKIRNYLFARYNNIIFKKIIRLFAKKIL